MAKISGNTFVGAMHGTIDGHVFRTYRRKRRDHIQVYAKPRNPARCSLGTQATRDTFAAADQYYKRIKADADLVARYRKAGKYHGLNSRQRAIRDFFSKPQVDDIDLTQYSPTAGGPIVVMASDDFEVTRVHVSVDDAGGGLVVEGDAVQRGGLWYYDAPPSAPGLQPTCVVVTAYDRPGHDTMKTFPLPAGKT